MKILEYYVPVIASSIVPSCAFSRPSVADKLVGANLATCETRCTVMDSARARSLAEAMGEEGKAVAAPVVEEEEEVEDEEEEGDDPRYSPLPTCCNATIASSAQSIPRESAEAQKRTAAAAASAGGFESRGARPRPPATTLRIARDSALALSSPGVVAV